MHWNGFKTENEMINDAGYNFYEEKMFWNLRDMKIPEKYESMITGSGTAESPTGFMETVPPLIGSTVTYDPKLQQIEADPNGKDLNSPGAKADAGKLLPWLVLGDFSRALEKVVEVGTLGATKYTKSGWITVPDGHARYLDAFGRHMLKFGSGEKYDNGPNGIGTKHIAQMIWNLLAVLELEEREESTSKT